MSQNSKIVRVGVIGFGTVGQGTVAALLKHKRDFQRRTGLRIVIKTIADRLVGSRDQARFRKIPRSIILTADPEVILRDREIDIVVELIGGQEPARALIVKALRNGQAVVTANKAVLASHWDEIRAAASEGWSVIKYEAAVGGVIPIINALEEGLVADQILSLQGVLNGTTNFILDQMEASGREFQDLLAEAQKKGYAEANPESDLSGEDVAFKILILTLILGRKIRFEEIDFTGVKPIKPIDFEYAHLLGYTIKLVAVSEVREGKLDVFVRPMLVPQSHPLAVVQGSLNKIVVRGKNSGETVYEGSGAGGIPTGIAVASNVITLARDLARRGWRRDIMPLLPQPSVWPLRKAKERIFEWYLRFIVRDRPGIIHDLSRPLKRLGISIKAIHQAEVPPELQNRLPFVVTIHSTAESQISQAVQALNRLRFMVEPPLLMPFLR